MAQVELIMPKMGESIMEATILKWVKKVGDTVELDETILEIATDKVDSEIPSPVAGTISKILFEENTVVEIGKVIALIATEANEGAATDAPMMPTSGGVSTETTSKKEPVATAAIEKTFKPATAAATITTASSEQSQSGSNGLRPSEKPGRFYSPLVRNIAEQEAISREELDRIPGSGAQGRVTKHDLQAYIQNRSTAPQPKTASVSNQVASAPYTASVVEPISSGQEEIIQMDRMRKLIADHMVMSKQTSPHVTSFVEADVTNIVNWRNKVKESFKQKYNENITFTPIFMEAVTKAIRDYPMVNVTVDGDRIIVKKDINIGMAAALPSGNLIVPVIRNADQRNLVGLTKAVNDLAGRARENKLKPDDIQGGTFTLTNVGTFGNVMGTPIINQPQVAILAVGAIRKKPAVVETEYGDLIAVRQMMFLSLSYDHRVVDGFLGGSFLRRVADYLEGFDAQQTI